MTNEEHNIQVACVRWFSYQFPELRGLLFAVPNGGRRDAVTGSKLKAEGVVPGVSDLILLMPSNGHGALLIEMKTERGRQTAEQKRWQELVERVGYQYAVCRSFDEFQKVINEYLYRKL